jgi:hypothetical protein
LDPIEKVIRSALEKGDADDRAFREKVYRSAFAALDRALQANAAIPADVAAKRRSDLQAKITEIETEFIPAVRSVDSPVVAPPPAIEPDDGAAPAAPVAPAIEVSPRGPAAPRAVAGPERVEPQLAGDPTPPARDPASGRAVPEPFFPDVADFDAAPPAAGTPEAVSAEVSAAGGPNVATDRRRPIVGLFLGVTLLALAGIGVWWGISTGLIKIPGPPETEDVVEQVPPEGEDFKPGEEEAPLKPGEADAARDWITVFSPTDPSTLRAPSDAKAETMSDDAGSFVRIRSGASGSAIVFDINKGVLEQLSGKHAEFNIVARSEEGKETQFSVECNFGELGDCGRKRYLAGYQKGDFLFAIDLPAKGPGADGTIAITSDVDNSGKAVDVFEIKVSVSG